MVDVPTTSLDTGPDVVAAVAGALKTGPTLAGLTYMGVHVASHVTDAELSAIAKEAIAAYVGYLTAPKL